MVRIVSAREIGDSGGLVRFGFLCPSDLAFFFFAPRAQTTAVDLPPSFDFRKRNSFSFKQVLLYVATGVKATHGASFKKKFLS